MDENCVLIPLSKTGKHAWQYTAIVSPEDADLADLNWTVHKTASDTQYAFRKVNTNGVRAYSHIHRVILERKIGRPLESYEEPDHINTNPLDNRRENLRIASRSQNTANRSPKKTKNGYKGITWHKHSKKWHAQIHIGNKHKSLGYFNTPEEAHKAYREGAVKYFGEFANLGGAA